MKPEQFRESVRSLWKVLSNVPLASGDLAAESARLDSAITSFCWDLENLLEVAEREDWDA